MAALQLTIVLFKNRNSKDLNYNLRFHMKIYTEKTLYDLEIQAVFERTAFLLRWLKEDEPLWKFKIDVPDSLKLTMSSIIASYSDYIIFFVLAN